METNDQSRGVVLAGSPRLAASLSELGNLGDPSRRGLVYDASESRPQGWDELEAELNELFRLTQEAVLAGAPIVYVVHEPSVWGHESSLRSALATALLGGMRSAAVELARGGMVANAVAVESEDSPERVARCVGWLLEGHLNGQLLTCGATHLGRPAA